MKKIDKLLISSFVPPFVVTFFIALFVLVMQTLWMYIDRIAGKGVGFFVLVELISYMSISMFPLALPIAVLITSVMTFGNLAERYELSSMKSAGVGLFRIMRPLMVFGCLISIFSFVCNNYLIPVSNLQFKSRLHDIQKQKPMLNMEEGLFNDDFEGYSIRLGDKKADERTIGDVLIYDHSASNKGQLTAITADSGEMYVNTQDFFIMDLYNGTQYSELQPTKPRDKKDKSKSYPYVRTSFRQWTKVFDLREFDLNRTDTELFKSHHSMLNASQLATAIDSIDERQAARVSNLSKNVTRNFRLFDFRDTTSWYFRNNQSLKKKRNRPERKIPRGREALPRDTNYVLAELDYFVQTFPKEKQKELANRAKTTVSSLHGQVGSTVRAMDRSRVSRVKHVFELHSKFAFALSCLLFLFVGAPMGAIVRKGGFGYPLLIAILFFVLFIVAAQFSKNIAERAVIDPVLSAWLPVLIFLPICSFLTIRAMNDRGLGSFGWVTRLVDFVKMLFQRGRGFVGKGNG